MKIDPVEQASTNARYQAVRKAWKREQQLVWEGKGTRDWTREQQRDILNLKKGRAYDDLGRAFEGQHMRSAAEYPEDLGNPDNIQFLTRDEHLKAHKGSWKNPTNWYYDPLTDTYTDFGNDQIAPCRIIELSDPVIAEGRANFYVIDPLTGRKCKPAASVRKCEEPEVIRRLNEGLFVRPADLAIAIAYERFRLNNERVTAESFKLLAADSVHTVDYCLNPEAVAIPIRTNRTIKYYYAVSDIDLNRLEERLNPEIVQRLRAKLEGTYDTNALKGEYKSVKADMWQFIRGQNNDEAESTRIMRSVYTFDQKSIFSLYNIINKHPRIYSDGRITVNRNSELVSLNEARKPDKTIIRGSDQNKPSRGWSR